MNWLKKSSNTSGEHALNEEQVRKLIDNCPELEHATLLSLAVTTGMRRSDIVRVKVDNIDINENKIAYKEMKKNDRIVVVSIPQRTTAMIQRWLNVRDIDSDYLFPAKQSNSSTGHISGRTAYNILQRNLDRVGLEQRPFHSLRATCIKLCQKKGWTPEQTSKHVGDKIETIQKYYLTPSDEEMSSVAQEKSLL